jgi:hypothetical protein
MMVAGLLAASGTDYPSVVATSEHHSVPDSVVDPLVREAHSLVRARTLSMADPMSDGKIRDMQEYIRCAESYEEQAALLFDEVSATWQCTGGSVQDSHYWQTTTVHGKHLSCPGDALRKLLSDEQDLAVYEQLIRHAVPSMLDARPRSEISDGTATFHLVPELNFEELRHPHKLHELLSRLAHNVTTGNLQLRNTLQILATTWLVPIPWQRIGKWSLR